MRVTVTGNAKLEGSAASQANNEHLQSLDDKIAIPVMVMKIRANLNNSMSESPTRRERDPARSYGPYKIYNAPYYMSPP